MRSAASATPAPGRRSDAARNRERLVEAARAAFTASASASPDGGTARAAAPVSLEAVARAAGVGIGTLYRHFPTREALVEEVYRHELEAICALAPALLDSKAPREALRHWIDAYDEFVATKRGMAETFRAILVAGTIAPLQTRARVTAAMAALIDAGVSAGVFRPVDPEAVVATLVGIHLAAPDAEQAGQRRAMVDLVVAGIER